MSRRPHKKSRHGCLECKRRHMRCDENHPVCVNCDAAGLRCSFLSRDSAQIVLVTPHGNSHVEAVKSSTEVSKNQTNICNWEHLSSVPLEESSIDTNSRSVTSVPFRAEVSVGRDSTADPYSVNTTHFVLFRNVQSKDFLSTELLGHADVIPISVYEQYSLTTPYLLHQLLATSALHLSITEESFRRSHHELATGLQARALTLFHQSNPELQVSSSNCVQLFLFSSLVSVHILCDTLHFQRDSLQIFLVNFTHCLHVYRGVLAIFNQSWGLLQETELGPALQITRDVMQSSDRGGSECDNLWNLISASPMTPSSSNACRDAILHLQRIFDAQRTLSISEKRMPYAAFAWPAVLWPEYVDLLSQGQPESLVILAHFAVILHTGRYLWLVGEAGRFLIESIAARLGPEWQIWMELPLSRLREELPT